MEFLADENFPMPSIMVLREKFKVHSVLEDFPGTDDKSILEKASKEDLIILTFDKDYGELIFRHGFRTPPEVVFFRFKANGPRVAGEILLDLIENRHLIIKNHFTIIDKQGVRQREYK